MAASINHVDKRGEGVFPKKPCLSTWVEGGLEACTLGHIFCGDPFFVHEFKKNCENFKKKLYSRCSKKDLGTS